MIRTLSKYYSDTVEGANSAYNGSNLQAWLDTEVRWKEGTVHPTAVEVQAKSEDLEALMTSVKAEYDSQEYARNRKAKYDLLNQDELRFDDLENTTTTWVDAINAIKQEYPK